MAGGPPPRSGGSAGRGLPEPARPDRSELAELRAVLKAGARRPHGLEPMTSAHPVNPIYCWVILTSSTAASTRLAVDASAAEIRMRTVWPANALMFAEKVAHTPLSLSAAP